MEEVFLWYKRSMNQLPFTIYSIGQLSGGTKKLASKEKDFGCYDDFLISATWDKALSGKHKYDDFWICLRGVNSRKFRHIHIAVGLPRIGQVLENHKPTSVPDYIVRILSKAMVSCI